MTVFLLLLLLSCAENPAVGSVNEDPCTTCGHWIHIDAPPHDAAFEVDCWVWVYNTYDVGAKYGGPVCVPLGD